MVTAFSFTRQRIIVPFGFSHFKGRYGSLTTLPIIPFSTSSLFNPLGVVASNMTMLDSNEGTKAAGPFRGSFMVAMVMWNAGEALWALIVAL